MAINSDDLGVLIPLGYTTPEGSEKAQKDFKKGADESARNFSKMKVAAVTAAAALGTVSFAIQKLNDQGEKSLAIENMGRILGETTEELREWEHLGAQAGIADMISQVENLSNSFAGLKKDLETGTGSSFTEWTSQLEALGIDTTGFEKLIKAGDEMGFVENLARQTEAKGLEGQDLMNVLRAAGIEGMFNLFDQPFEKFINQLERAQSAVGSFANEADAANSRFSRSMDVLGQNLANAANEAFAPVSEWLSSTVEGWNRIFEGSGMDVIDTAKHAATNLVSTDGPSVTGFIGEGFESAATNAFKMLGFDMNSLDNQPSKVNESTVEIQNNQHKIIRDNMGVSRALQQAQQGINPEDPSSSPSAPIIVQNMTVQSTATDAKTLSEEIQRDPTLHNYQEQKRF